MTRGRPPKNDAFVSVQGQSLCAEGKKETRSFLGGELVEDRETLELVQLMAPKAGFLPLRVVGHAARNAEQVRQLEHIIDIFDRLDELFRVHVGGKETHDE